LITPFKASFIENKLVVTNYYKDTLGIKDKIHIGDIIEKIDGIPVDALVKKYLPLTPASNYETQLRDMPSTGGFLLRSNDANAHFLIKRGNEEKEINVSRVPLRSNFNPMLDYIDENQVSGYKPLDSNIGYIYPAKLKEDDLANIEKDFANTKGLIIDLRCYPSTFMPFTYGQWLKSAPSPFVYFTVPNLTQPGSITYGDTLSNGSVNTNSYKGKIVIIVNSQTQSQAEYTTMALSTIPNAKVIGSTTAGADGNVSQIILPGGISTMFSGIGIYYPDGTETQRIGVKIDIPAKPTIKGILEGRDELLEKAIQILSREN
jgi:C-terminal processing protease CtpA/Prc